MSLLKNSFLTWCSSSLRGHIVLVETFSSLPIAIAFLSIDEEPFTVGRVLQLAFVWGIGGVVIATALWYTVSLPIIRRRNGRPLN